MMATAAKTRAAGNPGIPAHAPGISFVIGIKGKGSSRKSQVQSVLFNERWTVAKAKEWLKEHGFKYGEEEGAAGNVLRFRQEEPGGFEEFRTIKPDRRRNPELASESMYESFHGEPSTGFTEIREEEHYHGNLAELGELVELKVRTLSGYEVVLSFNDSDGKGERSSNPEDLDSLKKELSSLQSRAPLFSEGAISSTQYNRMSDRQKREYHDAVLRRYMVEDKIKDLSKTDEQRLSEEKARRRKKIDGRLLQLERHINDLETIFIQPRLRVGKKPTPSVVADLERSKTEKDALEAERSQNPYHQPNGLFNMFKTSTVYHVHKPRAPHSTEMKHGTHKGHEIYKVHARSGYEYVVPSIDRESRFESAREAKRFIEANPKRKLDLILDKVEAKKSEVTFDVRDYTEAQKNEIMSAARARGLDASSDGKHILVRDLRSTNPAHGYAITRGSAPEYFTGFDGSGKVLWSKDEDQAQIWDNRLHAESQALLLIRHGESGVHRKAKAVNPKKTKKGPIGQSLELIGTAGGAVVGGADKVLGKVFNPYAHLSDDENQLINHVNRWGSDGYPIHKTSKGWTWEYRGIKGPPVVFKTKQEAVKSFEDYYDILIDRAAKRINPKDPASMTAGEINKELDKLDKAGSKLTDEFIAAGRGHERPSEYLKMDDPLAMRARELHSKRQALQIEKEMRYGPGAPSRLPKGFGPRKRNPGSDDRVLLCSSEDGTALYLVGGDQSLDLSAIKMDGDWEKESMVIGLCSFVSYFTTKDFDKHKPIVYEHELGEDTGEMPTLRYDTVNKKLYLDGGQYHIEQPLLETSPGIEN